METGIICNWVAERGFGFIEPRCGGKNVFLHVSDIVNFDKDALPMAGDVVLFDTAAVENEQRSKAVFALLIPCAIEEETDAEG